MEHLEGIMKLADAELESIIKNGKFRSREEIDSVGKLIDMSKDIMCIWDMESDMDGESYDGGMSYERGGRSYRGGSYEGGSYARGRRNAKRDALGRYSRDGYRDGRSYRGYSRDGKEEHIEHLHEMLEDAPDEQTRQEIQRMISKMEKM